MSLKTKILSFIMAVGIAFSFSSCADTTYAHIINGDKVPSGVYLGYLVQAYMEGSQKVTDTAADPYTQQIDGVDFKQWVKTEHMKSQQRTLLSLYYSRRMAANSPIQIKRLLIAITMRCGAITELYMRKTVPRRHH